MKPLIGIGANISHPQDPTREFSKGTAIQLIQHHYIQFVECGGGIPVVLPIMESMADVAEAVSHMDGIIVTGGPDADPMLYGEPNKDDLSMGIDYRRDEMEITLVREAKTQKKALLGVCRGVQILNIALGGDMYQDLPTQFKDVLPHSYLKDRKERFHPVELIGKSFLTDIFGNDEKSVNSSHHQALRKLGKGLTIVAKAPDGVIEAVQDFDQRCFVGVQWHPERMLGNFPSGWPNRAREPQVRLARWFISMAAGTKQ